MAIYPKKSKDPTEVALSAIQDALNVRDTDPAPPIAATIATAAEASSESRKRVPRVAAGRQGCAARRNAPLDALPAPQDDRDIVQAANDDQESIGQTPPVAAAHAEERLVPHRNAVQPSSGCSARSD